MNIFNDLYGINGGLLSYDFAVFDSNNTLKYLIECQGHQYYEPVKKYGGVEKFDIQEEHDKCKRNYTDEHNIKLVEISYKYRKYGDVLYIKKEWGNKMKTNIQRINYESISDKNGKLWIWKEYCDICGSDCGKGDFR